MITQKQTVSRTLQHLCLRALECVSSNVKKGWSGRIYTLTVDRTVKFCEHIRTCFLMLIFIMVNGLHDFGNLFTHAGELVEMLGRMFHNKTSAASRAATLKVIVHRTIFFNVA